MTHSNGIHGSIDYINYTFNINRAEVYLAVLPLLYLIPSIFVTFQIFLTHFKISYRNTDSTVNQHIFLVISLSQFTCLLLLISEYAVNRLPATGIITSWCANSSPNHLLLWIFIFSMYITYPLRVFPFLLSFLRLTPITHPKSYHWMNIKILKCAIPFIFLYPIACILFLFPATGICKKLEGSYSFGSITIYYTDPMFGLRNSYFMIPVATFWLIACFLVDSVLFYKIRKVKRRNMSLVLNKNNRGYKAELSFSLTILAMLFSHLTNLGFVYSNVFFPQYTDYTFMIRPFGNDSQLVIVSWVFYLSHPIFRKSKFESISSVSGINNNAPTRTKSEGSTKKFFESKLKTSSLSRAKV